MADERSYPKLDTALSAALRAWEERGDAGHADDGVTVTLQFESDLAAIEAAGFETHAVLGSDAFGVVRFKDVPAIVSLPGVVRLSVGRRKKRTLDTAVEEILARASSPISGGTAVDGVWHIPDAGGTFTSIADATGKGVIVAVIDSGIDYKHPMFMESLGPPPKTRILAIWDQGLSPSSSAEWPTMSRLISTRPYGVEYEKAEIDADLSGGTALRHRDCDGHGTHVAGIAAGGFLFPTGGDAQRVGVAPEASIIVVKYLDNPEKLHYRNADNTPDLTTEVEWERRFQDAVMWCLRTARDIDSEPKPVVINMSFGDSAMPGDGLDKDAAFVDQVLDPTQTADDMHFPKGAIVVKSAGNDGDISDRQVAKITVPAAVAPATHGEIIVPFRLRDTRGTTNEQWKECDHLIHMPKVGIHFWYRRPTAPASVRFAMRTPHGDFGSDVSIPGSVGTTEHVIGFRHVVSLGSPTDTGVAASPSVFRAGIDHEDPGSVSHPSGGTVHRHYAYCYVDPKISGSTVSYHPGIYEVRIKAPPGTELFLMCEQEFWAAGKAVLFGVAPTMRDGSALPPVANLEVTVDSSSVDPMGQHAITVAAYDDVLVGVLADFSSRGPLRDFSNPPRPPPFAKPDIAAPGVDIDSAEGRETEAPALPVVRGPDWHRGIRFTEHSGTSMSAPMIAGVVALMLDKDGTLNTTQVRTHLAPPPARQRADVNAFGAGMVDAMTTHGRV